MLHVQVRKESSLPVWHNYGMRPRLLAVIAAFLLNSALLGTAAPAPRMESRDAEYNRKGMRFYNEAFYGKVPKGLHREAERLFDLAALEFQNAIAANPRSAIAYRNLARLYYVRKQFPQAAQMYGT